MWESVVFESEGAQLKGRLYRPDGRRPAPVVVMAQGVSAKITMTTDRYAEVFQHAGLAVLLYDHRNFGGSGGQPRHGVNPWRQPIVQRGEISYAATVAGLDGDHIAVWGDSFS